MALLQPLDPKFRVRRSQAKTRIFFMANYNKCSFSTYDCFGFSSKNGHGKDVETLFFPGLVLLGAPQGCVRVFVEDLMAPNKSHYSLTAVLSVHEGLTLTITFELAPLYKDVAKKKVPLFGVTSDYLSEEQMIIVHKKAQDARHVLFEATFGRYALDIIPKGPDGKQLEPLVIMNYLAPHAGAPAQVTRLFEDPADLRQHVEAVVRLSYEVQELRAQQLRDRNALAAMTTAKRAVEDALTAEKKRKGNSEVGDNCTKKLCKDRKTAHDKCQSAKDQKDHKKDHEAHQGCATKAADQRTEIANLKADVKDLRQELAAAELKLTSSTISKADMKFVVDNFTENAVKFLPKATAPEATHAPGAFDNALAQLLKLKQVLQP
jgi:hypothetical protein